MRALLDTCVLSELQNPKANPDVLRTIEPIDDDDLFISVVSLGEIAKGVAMLRDGAKKRSLGNWLRGLEKHYAARLLPIDVETSHIWGEITAAARSKGHSIAAADGLIAATALRHGLYVMTRNVADFEPTNVLLMNPFV